MSQKRAIIIIVCLYEWRIPTLISCQESISLSQEQCKTYGAHMGGLLVVLEVNPLKHSARICNLRLADL